MSENFNNQDCWVPLKIFAELIEWPTESGLRNYVHRAKELGIEKAFLRVKTRVLVNPKRFFELLEKRVT